MDGDWQGRHDAAHPTDGDGGMNRALKSALLAIGCVVGLPVAAFLAWDAVAFRPHLPEIDRILAQADAEDRDPPPVVRQLIEANVQGVVSQHVAMRLCGRLDPKPGNRHGTRALWALAVKLHFDPDERMALYAVLAWNGADYGLDRLARRMYGRSLSALTEREAARVVAMTFWPSNFARNTDGLNRRADFLLQHVGAR